MIFEKLLKRFSPGKLFYLINDSKLLFCSVPLQQMLDINDIIWYCSEIRHQIEKKRYQSPNNHHPLLKYVRSNSFLPPRLNPHPPATTTTAAAAAASSYSFSSVISTVNSLFE